MQVLTVDVETLGRLQSGVGQAWYLCTAGEAVARHVRLGHQGEAAGGDLLVVAGATGGQLGIDRTAGQSPGDGGAGPGARRHALHRVALAGRHPVPHPHQPHALGPDCDTEQYSAQ